MEIYVESLVIEVTRRCNMNQCLHDTFFIH